MQGDDCPATFVGLQEEAVVGVVVEEILGKGGCAEGVLEDEEVTFPVGIPVGIVFPELVPGEPERCSPVEAVCEPVAGGLAAGGVAGPAAGGHPLMAVAGSIGVDGYQADISFAQLLAPGVDALGAGAEGDVVFFRRDQGGVEAPVLEMLDYCGCDFACVFVFPEYAVRGAFAGGVAPVAVVDEDLHC